MESYVKSTDTKRFVIQDSFTKVTSDGEPHGLMTMIAGLSGLLAAIVILAVLVSLVSCKKGRRVKQCKRCPSSVHFNDSIVTLPCSTPDGDSELGRKRSSILNLLSRGSSVVDSVHSGDTDARPRLVSVSCISNGNFEGNLNSAFVGSELNLSGSLRKMKIRAPMRGQSRSSNEAIAAKETIIDMERY